MVKKTKPTDWVVKSDFPPPLNAGKELEEHVVVGSWVKSLDDSPLAGLLTIVQPIGYCEFAIDEEEANKLIQQLRQFIAGQSESAYAGDLDGS